MLKQLHFKESRKNNGDCFLFVLFIVLIVTGELYRFPLAHPFMTPRTVPSGSGHGVLTPVDEGLNEPDTDTHGLHSEPVEDPTLV